MVGVVLAALLLGFAPARAWPYVLNKSVDGADVVPAAPTVYALRDKGMYPKFAALKTGKDRAKLSAFEELQYLQFKSKICHSGAHPIGRRIYGEVAENNIITHKIMAPPKTMGTITYLAPAGKYTTDDVVLKVKLDGKEIPYTMSNFWPVPAT